MRFSAAFVSLSMLVTFVRGHGALTAVQGANGVTGQGFGIDPSTPRDGSRPNPFEQDTSIIRDNEVASGKASACGRTKIGGVNDIASQLSTASSAGLPSAGSDGSVSMTLHQVNQDGAGPYTCDVNTDGTGANFQKMTVTSNVPGFASLSFATAKDFNLVAQMPAGATCTGGPDSNACIVRCRNAALAGPFGGCVAVTNGDGAAAAGNSTGAAVAATPATPAASTAADTGAGGLGGLSGILGGLGGGADAGAGGAGGLGGILGGLGLGGRAAEEKKRVVKSRIVSRQLAGRWI